MQDTKSVKFLEPDKTRFCEWIDSTVKNGMAVLKTAVFIRSVKMIFLAYRVLEKKIKMCYNHSRA